MQRTREPFLLFQGNLEALKNRGFCLFQKSPVFEKNRELMNSQFQMGVCVAAYWTLEYFTQMSTVLARISHQISVFRLVEFVVLVSCIAHL